MVLSKKAKYYLYRTSEFLSYNWGYIIWFAFYFCLSVRIVRIFTDTADALLITGIIYAVSVSIALSPIGEGVLRLLEGIRPLRTASDKHYLEPIFAEVYQSACITKPYINKYIRLYIKNSYDINAFAMGRSTIAVTKGAMKGLSKNALKGVIAHEFGHIAHANTSALLLTLIGNGFFSLFIIVFNLVCKIIDKMLKSSKDVEYIGILFKLIKGVLRLSIFLICVIGDLILALSSRYAEYKADQFAYITGYGANLVEALYVLYDITIPQDISIKEQIYMSHPYLDNRIERLEKSLFIY